MYVVLRGVYVGRCFFYVGIGGVLGDKDLICMFISGYVSFRSGYMEDVEGRSSVFTV